MTTSELMQAMAAAGAPFEAILIAVRAIEEKDAQLAGRDADAAAKRAKDAERKRIARGSVECPENVHGHGADMSEPAPLPLPPNDNNSNPPTPAPENNTPRVKAEAHVAAWWAWQVKNPFPRPHWAEPQPWADFLKIRRKKNLSNTVTAHAKLLRDVATMAARTRWPPGKVFRACVEKNWGAIYETDEMKAAINANGNGDNQRSAPSGSAGGRDNRDGFAGELDAEIARARGGEAGRSGAGDRRGDGHVALARPAAVR